MSEQVQSKAEQPESDTPKEDAYDDLISPLMEQVIALAKQYEIPMYASFALDTDQCCTTILMPPVESVPEDDREGYAQWRGPHEAAAAAINATEPAPLSITMRDSNDQVKWVEVIVP